VSGNVPASTRTLRVLTFLATQPGPVPMERIASAVGLPRSSTYHLLRAMIDEGFVVHLPEEKRYGLGVAAFEIGSAYLRHDPLERLRGRCSCSWCTRWVRRRISAYCMVGSLCTC
jgi:DNA-binding IclR family transcriptional regulator